MKKEKRKGNVLVVTLIILSVILIAALSMSLTSIKERRGSMAETKTNAAIQNAQTGLEIVLDKIRTARIDSGGNTIPDENIVIKDTWPADDDYYWDDSSHRIQDSSGQFYVELYDSDLDLIEDGNEKFDKIYRVKSVGIGQGETRAIEAGIE